MGPDRSDRATGVALLTAAVLLTGGNLAHPVDQAPSATSRLALATDPTWLTVHLVVAVGFLALATGLVLLAARSRGTIAGTTTAVTGIVGGGTMALVFAGLDGYGFRALAAAPDTTGAATAALALDAIDTGLAGLGTALVMGVAMLGLAAVLRRDRDLAGRWAAPACTAVGVAGILTGLALLSQGATTTTINVLLRPTAMAMTLVVVALGVGLVRGVSASARRVSG